MTHLPDFRKAIHGTTWRRMWAATGTPLFNDLPPTPAERSARRAEMVVLAIGLGLMALVIFTWGTPQ